MSGGPYRIGEVLKIMNLLLIQVIHKMIICLMSEGPSRGCGSFENYESAFESSGASIWNFQLWVNVRIRFADVHCPRGLRKPLPEYNTAHLLCLCILHLSVHLETEHTTIAGIRYIQCSIQFCVSCLWSSVVPHTLVRVSGYCDCTKTIPSVSHAVILNTMARVRWPTIARTHYNHMFLRNKHAIHHLI